MKISESKVTGAWLKWTTIMVLSAGVVLASPLAQAVSGSIAAVDGTPIPYAYIGLVSSDYQYLGAAISDARGSFAINVSAPSGYLFVQPNALVNAQGLGIYPYEPRTYVLNGEQTVGLRLPPTGCIVLKGYDAGKLMRWADFAAKGTVAGQFMYVTSLDDELRQAACWPVYDNDARAQGSPWDKGLPGLVVAPGQTVAVNVMFWDVLNYGKLLLKADNSGQGYTLGTRGEAKILDLNVELASTAVADLNRRKAGLPSSGATRISNLNTSLANAKAMANPVQRAAAADKVLSDALKLRDDLELQAAKTNLLTMRKGSLAVVVKKGTKALAKCKVSIKQKSHSFKFGFYQGGQYNGSACQAAKNAGFEMTTMLFGWSWMEKIPGVLLDAAMVDSYYGVTTAKNLGLDVKAAGVVWMQDYGILPQRCYSMAWPDVEAQVLNYQENLLKALSGKIKLWEAVNEAPATDAVDMPRDAMNNLVALAAGNIKAVAGLTALVNSAHEVNFGAKYLYYGVDNQPVDKFTLTYNDFLKQATSQNCLNDVSIIGLQFYPGYKLNAGFGCQEGPAMTPSWLVDAFARYARFNRPIHITEFSVPSVYGADWKNGYWREKWTETTQADYAQRVFTEAFAASNVQSVTWWDMLDTNAAVLFGGLVDDYGRKKAAFTRIQGLIKGWTTQASGTTNTYGKTTLSGFGGLYDVTITTPTGSTVTRQATINERSTVTLSVTF